jgi:hypothetical protein
MCQAKFLEKVAGDVLASRYDLHDVATRRQHFDRPLEKQHIRRVHDINQDTQE